MQESPSQFVGCLQKKKKNSCDLSPPSLRSHISHWRLQAQKSQWRSKKEFMHCTTGLLRVAVVRSRERFDALPILRLQSHRLPGLATMSNMPQLGYPFLGKTIQDLKTLYPDSLQEGHVLWPPYFARFDLLFFVKILHACGCTVLALQQLQSVREMRHNFCSFEEHWNGVWGWGRRK